jgi:hypothetical protein
MIATCCLIPKGYCQSTVDYGIHANIVYRFTKYINWPPEARKGDFIIGIVGETPLYGELKKLTASKKVGNQQIVVKQLSPYDNTYECALLFISEKESRYLKRIVGITAKKPILIVSEDEGLAKKGSCINLMISGGRLKLEFNINNMEKRNLDAASELIGLGTIVN